MILSRFINNIKKQDWFVVFIELIIVVSGVYLGIYIGDVAKQKEIDKNVNQAVTILVRQLGEEITSINHVIKVQRREVIDYENAISILSAGKIDINKYKSASVNLLQYSNETFYPNTSVFKTMQNQGLITEIKNIELQLKIINLFEKIYIRHSINSANLDHVLFTFEHNMMNKYWDRGNNSFVNNDPETIIIYSNGIRSVIGEKQHYLSILEDILLAEIHTVVKSLNDYLKQKQSV